MGISWYLLAISPDLLGISQDFPKVSRGFLGILEIPGSAEIYFHFPGLRGISRDLPGFPGTPTNHGKKIVPRDFP